MAVNSRSMTFFDEKNGENQNRENFSATQYNPVLHYIIFIFPLQKYLSTKTSRAESSEKI